jgi:hypothetical protein
MNQDYDLFYYGLKGLTNAEASSEISNKITALAKKRQEVNRATIMEEQLKQLLNKIGELEQKEMFRLKEKVRRR